jgi:hypothetical protein
MHAMQPIARPGAVRRRPFAVAVVATAAAVVATIAGPGVSSAAAATARATAANTSISDIADDASWLLQGQLPDGAIAWYIDKGHISPYLGNYAAIGLAEATKQTGSAAYSDAGWSWLRWYAEHQDANGFVTDYNVDAAGLETSTGDEDSTDAYAGTYLSAVRATYAVDPDASELSALHASLVAAVGAIEATQDTDGLTWAKPSWHVKYLMDQTEAYNGLRSAVDLANSLGDKALRKRADADAARMKAGIASLWDAPTGGYDWAKSGGVNTTDWGVLYSDAMEQAWIAGSRAISASQAKVLMNTLAATEPQWSSPTALADMFGSTGTVGYWPVAGWALLRLGRDGQAAAAASSIRSAAITAGRGWPFTTGNAGQLIVLESGDTSLITP